MSTLARQFHAQRQAALQRLWPTKRARRDVQRPAAPPEEKTFQLPQKYREPPPQDTPPQFIFPAPVNRVRVIQDVASSYYGFSRNDLVSERRNKPLVAARHVAMYIAKELTTYSLPRLGREFRRDHTTALHALTKVTRRLAEEPGFAAEVATIRRACEAAIEHVKRERGNGQEG